MRRKPAVLLILALYRKVNKIESALTETEADKALIEMQDVAEFTDDQLETDEGLYEMAISYAIYKDAYEDNQKQESREYHRMYS